LLRGILGFDPPPDLCKAEIQDLSYIMNHAVQDPLDIHLNFSSKRKPVQSVPPSSLISPSASLDPIMAALLQSFPPPLPSGLPPLVEGLEVNLAEVNQFFLSIGGQGFPNDMPLGCDAFVQKILYLPRNRSLCLPVSLQTPIGHLPSGCQLNTQNFLSRFIRLRKFRSSVVREDKATGHFSFKKPP